MPLRVVLSSTLSSKRCLGIGFLSRAYREIAVFRHVATPSRLCLEFPHETASSEVRGEGREPLPEKSRGISPPVALRRGEGAQMKWCQEPRCSPRVRPVCRGTFGVALRVPNIISHFKTERGTTLETLERARASSCDDGGTTWFFSRCHRILALRQGIQASSCAGPGKSSLPFEW